jgi:DNA segregation ATPase FtsK/SpoIIIE, S-DNA-T family
MQTGRTRFLPKALTVELRRLPWRLIGLSLIAGAVACWFALVSWSYADPSLNYATLSQPQNWLGRRGASLADGLMLGFGLASTFLVLPILALGLQIAVGSSPLRPRLRLFFWLAAMVAVPAFFASFPSPSRWMFNAGLGGIVGDFAAARAAKLVSVMPQYILWPCFALTCLLLSVWCLSQACGLSLRDMALALNRGTARNADRTWLDDPFEPHGARLRLVNRATSWTKRFSARSRAPVATGRQPREFWMTPQRAEPSSAPARGEKPRGRRFNPAERPRTVKSSPFAHWGNRRSGAASGDPAEFQTSTHRTQDSDGDLVDDVRAEPFFGPQRRATPSWNTEDEDGQGRDAPASLFRRVEGKAKAAENNDGRRGFESAANGVKGRKPLIYVKKAPSRSEAAFEEQPGDLGAALPPVSLLAPPPRTSNRPKLDDPALMRRAAELMAALGDFGVKGRMSGVYPGPVITLFELEPARGTKSSRVAGLADDIARSVGAPSARVAPVPGRDAIGIELPNPKREIVSLRAILESQVFQDSQAALPLALGKSIGGEPIVADLARMPHLLVAGTTGSGKSVGINAMILSLLYRLPPSQCNFIMIDPKMLELSVYDGIPHLLAPVVTDPRKAVCALKWIVDEMNMRYERMTKLGVRNITSYNAKVAAAQLRRKPLRRTVQTGFHPRTGEHIDEEEIFDPLPMPYIVVVIDEMADLMMVAGKEVEFAVRRLSQMARAAGIHLIMATQRPSVDIVTGTIKANFPSRVSFQVTSKIDSRTILGVQGAEQLLGAGDMLYMASGGRIVRAHGPFVSDDEVEAVTGHLRALGLPSYSEDILEDGAGFDDDESSSADGDGVRDLYERAIEIVLRDRKPTASYLQRRLGVHYSRAASLIERMEREGIVGAPGRTGRRDILLDARH